MKRNLKNITLLLLLITTAFAYGEENSPDNYKQQREAIVNRYSKSKPKIFSQWTPGVKFRIDTSEKIAVITLDACGGKKGSGYDRELIDFLRENKIPASLFMTGLWIDANPALVKELAADPLFDIENHGMAHKPASVNGSKIYGRRGTKNPGELVDEVELNAIKIEKITGTRPIFYRPGTAYFDDVAVKIVYDLNQIPMNFSIVSGDAAGFRPEKITRRIVTGIENGSVIIGHMNRPGKNLYPAMKKSILQLKEKGYRFVKLREYRNSLK
ncbi:MAG TPA: polysaccharide deacetylase family protein [Spirochaetota bacterium]|nr:polysaccharide deacetylase family protein [Spirochaetota bacterium]